MNFVLILLLWPVIEVPAEVPGGIYSDLDAASVFRTPIYYRYNDLETRWVGRTNWTFSRSFEGTFLRHGILKSKAVLVKSLMSVLYISVQQSFVSKRNQVLVCEGLDTIANVFVNDVLVGRSENMFVRYIYNISSAVKV